MPDILLWILYILGAALFIVLVALLLPVKVYIKTTPESKISAKVKILFFTITPKKDNKKEDMPEAEGGKVASFFGFSDFSSFRALKEKLKKSGLTKTVSSLFGIVIDLIKRATALFCKCRLKRLYLRIVCANPDAAVAAIEYGAVCSVVYPAVSFISSAMKTRSDALDINLLCGYDEEEPSFEFDIYFSVRVFYIVKALLGIIFDNAKKEIANGR